MKNTLTICGLAIVLGYWMAYPIMTLKDGTSENISIKVLAEPFIGSETLVYRWKGDVVRRCPITIRREIVDNENVVTQLLARSFDPVPKSDLGHSEYEVRIDVPRQIASGPATYQATEVPSCTWLQRLVGVEIEYPPVEFTVTRPEDGCRYKISASGAIHGPDSPHWSQTSTDRCFPTRAAAEAALE